MLGITWWVPAIFGRAEAGTCHLCAALLVWPRLWAPQATHLACSPGLSHQASHRGKIVLSVPMATRTGGVRHPIDPGTLGAG